MARWVSKTAVVVGNVELGDNVSVYYNTTIRCETDKMIFGEGTNIQDNCVCHGDKGMPVVTGKNVTIGHGCIIHGCSIGENSLIGMGSIVMNRASIGKNCIIGAGSLVTEGTVIPDDSVAFGRPCKVIRPITEQEIENNRCNALHYIEIMPIQIENEKGL